MPRYTVIVVEPHLRGTVSRNFRLYGEADDFARRYVPDTTAVAVIVNMSGTPSAAYWLEHDRRARVADEAETRWAMREASRLHGSPVHPASDLAHRRDNPPMRPRGRTRDLYSHTARGTRVLVRDLHDMTEREINRLIFPDALPTNKLVGLRDVLTDDEITNLPNHPAWPEFSQHFRDWVYSAIEAILDSEQ